MKKIYIDLNSKEDILERYNNNVISNELIEYIVNQTPFSKKEKIEIIINNKTDIKVTDKLKQAFKDNYQDNLKYRYYNDVRQLLLLLGGIIFLIFSMIIKTNILNEVISVGSWVLLWEVFDSQLFFDSNETRKRMKLKKLINAKITENME